MSARGHLSVPGIAKIEGRYPPVLGLLLLFPRVSIPGMRAALPGQTKLERAEAQLGAVYDALMQTLNEAVGFGALAEFTPQRAGLTSAADSELAPESSCRIRASRRRPAGAS